MSRYSPEHFSVSCPHCGDLIDDHDDHDARECLHQISLKEASK